VIDLSLERPGNYNYVRAVGAEGIRIADRWYRGPLLLTPDAVRTDWPPRDMSELRIEDLQAIFDLRPEVALLGTGPAHELLARGLLVELYRRGATLEVMATDAACRTFNVLAGDNRSVVAGLMPVQRRGSGGRPPAVNP
jgi:uncharacterized protein